MNSNDSEVAIIKAKLTNQLEKVIDQFLPGGKYTNGRYVCGSINGGEGKSFSIQLAGANRGVWKDFSEDTHGDVLKIFYYHAGENYSSMMNLARSFLGMESAKPKVSFKRPTDKDMGEELSHIGDVFEYLTSERKIPEEILTACEVRQTHNEDGYVFLFRPAKKKEIVCLTKTVMLARENGKKKEWSSKDGLWVLWGMHAAVDHTYESQDTYLIITEGEIDAMSYMAEGFRAVSIPGGVQNMSWIELCFEWLSQFKTIYLSFDMDDKGGPAVERVAARLGIDRCKVIELPKKDANKCLQEGISLRQYVEQAKELKPDKLVSAFELRDLAWERITRGRMEELGIPFMGWEGDESINFKLRERECTLYTGYPGHGKAQPFYSNVLMSDGKFKKMGDVKVGDSIASIDGSKSEVTHTYERGDMNVVRLRFSDGSFVDCSTDHLWLIRLQGNRRRVMRTSEIISFLNKPNAETTRMSVIEFSGEIQDPYPAIINPYLLGVLIGDGGLTGNAVKFTSADQQIVDSIIKILDGHGKIVPIGKYGYRITGRMDIKWTLEQLGLMGKRSECKFIPRECFSWSRENRMMLLRGIMDTDGWAQSRSDNSDQILFGSSSYQLAMDVRELVMSLGGHCGKIQKKKTSRLDAFIITIRAYFKNEVFSLKRKLDILTRSGRKYLRKIVGWDDLGVMPVKCITVSHDAGLYITDNYIVTHNSNLLYQLTAYMIGEHQQKVAIASLEEPADKILNVILFHLLAEALTDDSEETREKFEMAMKVIGNNLFIYHHVGIAPLKDIIAFSEFCVNRHGCQHFILDSVARTDLNIENNEDANEFMEKIIVSMNRTGAHYHMVAHSRKGQSGDFTSIPGKDEVKGSAQFGNLTYNILTCWKNQKKYDILASGKSDMEDASNIRENWGDGKIRISKQKVGGMEGEYKIYYNPSNYRFRRSYHATDYPYFGSSDKSPF